MDVTHAAVESGLVRLVDQHWNACVGEHHGNPAAHRTRAHHAGRLDRNNGRGFRNVRNLGDFALTKENVHERLGLRRRKTLDEQFLLDLTAFFKRHLRRGFYGVDGGQRRDPAALFFAHIFSRCSKDGRILLPRAELVAAFPRF